MLSGAQRRGGEIVLQFGHAQVPRPVSVRYGGVDNAGDANPVNCVGLPASPFRTDHRRPTTEAVRVRP